MWIRSLGAGLILLSACAWVGRKNREEREELARVAAFAELFAQMGGRIESLCLPLDEILASLPQSVAAAGMEAGTVTALRAAIGQVRDREAGACLRRTAERLGQGTSGEQIRLCRTAAEELARCRERIAAAVGNNARARTTCMLCAALGITILLW